MLTVQGPFLVGESIDSVPQSDWESFVKKEGLPTQYTHLEAIGRWAGGNDPTVRFDNHSRNLDASEMLEHVDELKFYTEDVAKQNSELKYWEDLGAETLRAMIREDISKGSQNIYQKNSPKDEIRGGILPFQGYWWDNNLTYFSDFDFSYAIRMLLSRDHDFEQEVTRAVGDGKIPIKIKSYKERGRPHLDGYGFIK